MVLDTSKDIETERRKNNAPLNLKIPLKEREERLRNNDRLKRLEAYAKEVELLKVDDFTTLTEEYKKMVNDLDEYTQINGGNLLLIEQQAEELVEAIKSLHTDQEILQSFQIRLAVVGTGLENHYIRLNTKFNTMEKSNGVVQSTEKKKEKKLPEKDYRELVFHVYGRNKGLAVLRDEGYDV